MNPLNSLKINFIEIKNMQDTVNRLNKFKQQKSINHDTLKSNLISFDNCTITTTDNNLDEITIIINNKPNIIYIKKFNVQKLFWNRILILFYVSFVLFVLFNNMLYYFLLSLFFFS